MALPRKGEGLCPRVQGSDSTFPKQGDALIGSSRVCVLAGHSLMVSAQSSTGFLARTAFGIGRSAAALPSMKVFWTSLLFSPH